MYNLHIIRGNNGYRFNWTEETEDGKVKEEAYIQDDMVDTLKSGQELLWFVLHHFGLSGSKHDPERLRVVREKRDE